MNWSTSALVLSLLICLCAAPNVGRAKEKHTEWRFLYRNPVTNENRLLFYELKAGEDAWEYANDGVEKEPCGDEKHKTSKGKRYFDHNHADFPFPEGKVGMTKTKQQYTIKKENVKAYWDWRYGPDNTGGDPIFTSYGDVDHKCNCFGHALYYDTWINDPSFIYADDYEPQTEPAICDVIDIKKGGASSHAIYITSTMKACNEQKFSVGMTSERNSESPTYSRTYLKGVQIEVPAAFSSPGNTPSLHRKKKP